MSEETKADNTRGRRSRAIQGVALAAVVAVAVLTVLRVAGGGQRHVAVRELPGASPTATSARSSPSPDATPSPAAVKLCDQTIARVSAPTYVVRSKHQLPFDTGALAGALFVWDPATDRETALTPEDGKRRALPSYRASRLWYVVWAKDRFGGASSVCAADVRRGTVEDVLDLHAAVQAYDVDPAGERLVYHVRAAALYETHLLRLSDGADTVLLRGDVRPHAGVLNYDDVHVAWSPDASMILVNDTFARADGFRIVRPDGSDVLPPRAGMDSAFWAREPGRVIYAPYGEGQGAPKDWFDLDVASGTATAYRANGGRYRGSLSPDGSKIAYDLAPNHSSMYDIEQKGLTPELGGNKAALVWLNDHLLLATETTWDASWRPKGVGLILDVDNLGPGWKRAGIGSTFDAAIVRG